MLYDLILSFLLVLRLRFVNRLGKVTKYHVCSYNSNENKNIYGFCIAYM